MWLLFAFDVVIALVLFFLPGFLVLKGFGLSSFKSFALGPVASILVLYLTAFCLLKLNITGAWEVVVIPVLVMSFMVFAIGCVVRSRLVAKGKHKLKLANSVRRKQQWLYLGTYVGFAAIVGLMVFVKTLDGAASFNQQNDNFAHLAAVRQFLEMGVYAKGSLVSYPSAWYNISALVASIGQQEVCVAINAVNYVIASFVFPAGVCALMSAFFKDRKGIMICGAICCVAFTEYPWGLLLFGPLYPNLLGYALLPAVMTCFIGIFRSEETKSKLLNGLLFVLGCIALLFAHPNAIFSGIVILTPFVCAWIVKGLRANGEPWVKKSMKMPLLVGFMIVVISVWVACYYAPAFAGTVQFTWPATLTLYQAVANELLLALTQYSVPQLLLAVLVLIGVAVCLVKKNNRWMIVSYVFALFILTAASSSEGFIKHLLAGFWYTDTYRLATTVAIAGIPLASMGLYYAIKALVKIAENAGANRVESKRFKVIILCIVTIFLFIPNLKVQFGELVETPFGHVEGVLERFNTLSSNAVYDEDEVGFVDQVKDVVGDSVVLNVPFDGSALSYGVNGLHVVNLDLYGYPNGTEGLKGTAVRGNLDEYVNNQNIKDTLESNDIQYLLLLDIDDWDGERTYPDHVDLSSWSGLMNVTEDTPGFELMLSEGDMRLYKLTDL